jgi:hypothetical protein
MCGDICCICVIGRFKSAFLLLLLWWRRSFFPDHTPTTIIKSSNIGSASTFFVGPIDLLMIDLLSCTLSFPFHPFFCGGDSFFQNTKKNQGGEFSLQKPGAPRQYKSPQFVTEAKTA